MWTRICPLRKIRDDISNRDPYPEYPDPEALQVNCSVSATLFLLDAALRSCSIYPGQYLLQNLDWASQNFGSTVQCKHNYEVHRSTYLQQCSVIIMYIKAYAHYTELFSRQL